MVCFSVSKALCMGHGVLQCKALDQLLAGPVTPGCIEGGLNQS